jgi:hypothetical protein
MLVVSYGSPRFFFVVRVIGGVGKIPDWEAQSALLHYLDFVIALMKVRIKDDA